MVYIVMRQKWGDQAQVVGLFRSITDAVKAREASFKEIYNGGTQCVPACWIEHKSIK
jgi:hypothetical protein